MEAPTHSQADSDYLPDRQLDRWPLPGEQLIGLAAQEIPETQLSTGSLSSDPVDEDGTFENVHEIVNSTSATKRKRDIDAQNPPRKKSKQLAEELAIADKFRRLEDQLKVVEQDLEAEKEKVRALEKKIDELEEGRKTLVDRLEARGEAIGDRDGSVGRVKILERRVERTELAMAILANVIKLSSLPFEDEG